MFDVLVRFAFVIARKNGCGRLRDLSRTVVLGDVLQCLCVGSFASATRQQGLSAWCQWLYSGDECSKQQIDKVLAHTSWHRLKHRLTDRQADRQACMHKHNKYLASMLFVVMMFFGSLKPTMAPSTWFTATT